MSSEKKKDWKRGRNWLIIGPFVIVVLFCLMTGPDILNAAFARMHIDAVNLPNSVQLRVTLEPNVSSLDSGYFVVSSLMEMGILENSTTKLDYNVEVLPSPISSDSSSAILGTSVGFNGLVDTGQYISYDQYSNGSVVGSRYEGYSYSVDLLCAYSTKTGEMFPGDFYSSSTFYFWFNASCWPEIVLSPASSLPKGFVAYLTSPKFISANEFYWNRIDRFSHLFLGMPSSDVMTFQIVIQRDDSSILLYSFYTVILLFAACEILVLSHFKVEKLGDKLGVFVGLAIASVAFLYSIRQVANMISWSEVALVIMLGIWILFEVRDAWRDI